MGLYAFSAGNSGPKSLRPGGLKLLWVDKFASPGRLRTDPNRHKPRRPLRDRKSTQMITRAAQGAKPGANGKWIVAVAYVGRAFNRIGLKEPRRNYFRS